MGPKKLVKRVGNIRGGLAVDDVLDAPGYLGSQVGANVIFEHVVQVGRDGQGAVNGVQPSACASEPTGTLLSYRLVKGPAPRGRC
jgi:hypothetical protein